MRTKKTAATLAGALAAVLLVTRCDSDLLHVAATTALGAVAANVTVGVDEPCRCHVQRLSGPDLVALP